MRRMLFLCFIAAASALLHSQHAIRAPHCQQRAALVGSKLSTMPGRRCMSALSSSTEGLTTYLEVIQNTAKELREGRTLKEFVDEDVLHTVILGRPVPLTHTFRSNVTAMQLIQQDTFVASLNRQDRTLRPVLPALMLISDAPAQSYFEHALQDVVSAAGWGSQRVNWQAAHVYWERLVRYSRQYLHPQEFSCISLRELYLPGTEATKEGGDAWDIRVNAAKLILDMQIIPKAADSTITLAANAGYVCEDAAAAGFDGFVSFQQAGGSDDNQQPKQHMVLVFVHSRRWNSEGVVFEAVTAAELAAAKDKVKEFVQSGRIQGYDADNMCALLLVRGQNPDKLQLEDVLVLDEARMDELYGTTILGLVNGAAIMQDMRPDETFFARK